MSSWLILLIIVGVAAATFLYVRWRRDSRGSDAGLASVKPDRNYVQEREDHRVGQMNEEDRAWEAASLQKHHDAAGHV